MKMVLHAVALAVVLTFSVGSLSLASDPAPVPQPTEEKGKKDGSGPKLVSNEKDEQKDKKDDKGR